MNSPIRHRPLAIGPVRAFEAVARLLNFRAAAEEMHLTQSAVSRQIKALEEEIGVQLFVRGTRHVELTGAGQVLLRGLVPALQRIDGAVRELRLSQSRRTVRLTTYASFASMWLLPRLPAFEQAHPDIDIRVSASDAMVDLEDSDFDLALRCCLARSAGPQRIRLFGEVITPVASPWLVRQSLGLGAEASLPAEGPYLETSQLAGLTLLEQEDDRPSAEWRNWRAWLDRHAPRGLQPRRWVYLNYFYQEIQAAVAGQGVALARQAMVVEALAKGELVELFDARLRTVSPHAYWLIPRGDGTMRPEVQAFVTWLREEAARTREATGEVAEPDPGPGEAD